MSLLGGRLRRPGRGTAEVPSGTEPGEVRGERARLAMPGSVSLQTRLGNALALGFVLALGALALIWYYRSTAQRRMAATRGVQRAPLASASAGAALPRLGPLRAASPRRPPAAGLSPPGQLGSAAQRPPRRLTPPQPSRPVPLARERRAPAAAVTARRAAGSSMPDPATARRLMGAVFVASTHAGGTAGAGASPAGSGASGPGDALAALLQPTAIAAVRARRLPTQRLLLAQGTFIDCTLQTAIDSTLPGMTTCTTATDTFSADGQVVLLERGTKLIGETRGSVQRGSARVFVLWTEARTPDGVVVPLDSPGTDALGRSGLPGRVERHFWQRFGAAILVSMIDGAVQAAVQSSSSGGGTVIYNPSASGDVMSEVLKGSVDIPPTVLVAAGARIEVLVARDVDFRSVYELRSARAQR